MRRGWLVIAVVVVALLGFGYLLYGGTAIVPFGPGDLVGPHLAQASARP